MCIYNSTGGLEFMHMYSPINDSRNANNLSYSSLESNVCQPPSHITFSYNKPSLNGKFGAGVGNNTVIALYKERLVNKFFECVILTKGEFL